MQLAAARGLRCVAVVRDRPEFEALQAELEALGATVVLRAGAVRRSAGEAGSPHRLAALPPARLALNAVGGDGAAELAGLLGKGGTLVTYGGMARQPLQLSTASFVFRNMTARGFWLTDWTRRCSLLERVRPPCSALPMA